MSDNHSRLGSPDKSKNEHDNRSRKELRYPLIILILVALVTIFQIVTGAHGVWRQWYVIVLLMLVVLMAGIAFYYWLRERVMWHDDHVFNLSAWSTVLILASIGVAYLYSMPKAGHLEFLLKTDSFKRSTPLTNDFLRVKNFGERDFQPRGRLVVPVPFRKREVEFVFSIENHLNKPAEEILVKLYVPKSWNPYAPEWGWREVDETTVPAWAYAWQSGEYTTNEFVGIWFQSPIRLDIGYWEGLPPLMLQVPADLRDGLIYAEVRPKDGPIDGIAFDLQFLGLSVTNPVGFTNVFVIPFDRTNNRGFEINDEQAKEIWPRQGIIK